MNTPTRTPRTDELVKELYRLKSNTLEYPCEQQLRELCHQLETELTSAKADVERLKAALQAASDCDDTLHAYEIIADLIGKKKTMQSEIERLKKQVRELGKDKFLFDWCDRNPLPDFSEVGNDSGWNIRDAIRKAIDKAKGSQ